MSLEIAFVPDLDRIRRQQSLREAEGYLELISLASEFGPISQAARNAVGERALDILSELEQTRGRRSQVLYLKGQTLRAMERYREALVPLRAAADMDADNLDIWLALGWCHKRTGHLDLAIQALEEALAVDGEHAIIHYNLACYWALANNPKLAVAYLSRAFDIDGHYRDLVSRERDFDTIRNHPEFQMLTSVIV